MARIKNFNREEALQKALQLFWCKGYHATSMQDLVDHMQINRSSLYDTFGDKHTVFIEALKQYQLKNTQALIKEFTETANIKATIVNLFKTSIEETLSCNTKNGCFMVNASIEMASFDSETDQIINQNNLTVQEALHQALLKAQAKGEFDADKDSRAISRFLMNTLSGIRVAARTSTCKQYYEDVVTIALSVL